MSLPANFKGKYVERESGCWEWTAARQSKGYGSVEAEDARAAAEKRAAELAPSAQASPLVPMALAVSS